MLLVWWQGNQFETRYFTITVFHTLFHDNCFEWKKITIAHFENLDRMTSLLQGRRKRTVEINLLTIPNTNRAEREDCSFSRYEYPKKTFIKKSQYLIENSVIFLIKFRNKIKGMK